MTWTPRAGVQWLLAIAALWACTSRTSADSAGPASATPPGSMPLLSRALPVKSSSGDAHLARDFVPEHLWNCRGDCWLAYDLSNVPESMHGRVLVARTG